MANQGKTAAKAREEKQAAALRANLKKRKRQKEAWAAKKEKKEG